MLKASKRGIWGTGALGHDQLLLPTCPWCWWSLTRELCAQGSVPQLRRESPAQGQDGPGARAGATETWACLGWEGKAQGWSQSILWLPEGDLQRWQSQILHDRKIRQDKAVTMSSLATHPCWPSPVLATSLFWLWAGLKASWGLFQPHFYNFPKTIS